MPRLAEDEGGKIKPSGYQQEYTTKQIEELLRCANDAVYFIREYVYIQHPTRGAVKFNLFDYQESLVDCYNSNRLVIALLSRQCGKTATAAAYLLWYAIFKDDQHILIASKDHDGAKDIMSRLWYAYEELPWWLKPGCKVNQVHTKEFDNNSKLLATATTATSGRGKSNSLIYLDEFAFVRPGIANEFWTAIYPTIACVSGDTLVFTQRGFERIGNLHSGWKTGDYKERNDLMIYGKEGMEKVSHGYVSPFSATKKITTSKGRFLEATLDHPLYVPRSYSGEMVKAKNLTTNDYLRVDVGLNLFGNITLTPDDAYMLGGYTAEGWVSGNNGKKSTVWISNTDSEFRNVFLKRKKESFRVSNSEPTKLYCTSSKLVFQLSEWGVDLHAKCYDKRVPDAILQGTRETITNYLSGLFDGDGCACNKGVILTSTSLELLRDVQLLLTNLGFLPDIIPNKEQKSRVIADNRAITECFRPSWNLYIPLSQTQMFLDIIGFRINKKTTAANRVCFIRNQDDSKLFTIPVRHIRSTLVDLLTESGKSKNWWRTHGRRFDKCLDNHPNRHVTVNWLRGVESIVRHKLSHLLEKFEVFFQEYCRNSTWERIAYIEDGSCITYDFTVPGTHTFAQNGMIGSNTGGKCIITSTPNTDEDKFASIWFNSTRHPSSDVWRDVFAERQMLDVPDENTEEYDIEYETEDARMLYSSKEEDLDIGDDDTLEGFIGFHAHWSRIPDGRGGFRDEKFKRQVLSSGLTEEEWLREYECAFVSGDSTLISAAKMATFRQTVRKPQFIDKWGMRWYEEILPNQIYGVVLDPSEGVAADDACIQVWEIPQMTQVAEWNNNYVDQVEQTKMLRRTLKRIFMIQMNDPAHEGGCQTYYSVERNGLGIGILNAIEYEDEMTFPGFLIDSTMTSINVLGGGMDTKVTNRWRGLLTSVSSKKRYAVEFKNLVERNLFVVRSKHLASQLKTFVKSGQSYAAKEGAKDDIVMSCILMCHLVDEIRYHEPDLDDLIRPDIDDYDPDDFDHPDNIALPPTVSIS